MSYANFQRTILLLKMLNIRALKYIINRVILAVFFRNMELDTLNVNHNNYERNETFKIVISLGGDHVSILNGVEG